MSKEPALIIGFVNALLALVAGFGWVHLTQEQMGLLTAVVAAALAVWVRQSVYSPQTAYDISQGVRKP